MIPYGRQHINGSDIDAVQHALESAWLTQGPAIEEFEDRVRGFTGAKHAVALCNATAALHLACRAVGVKPGDVLWTSPNTFVASANCAIYCGADVDFVDIDPRTYNMSVPALEKKLIDSERRGRLPKVVVPVHFAGQSCEMRRINELARQYGFSIIEDASHAIGGRYEGKPVGDGRYSDITVFSFHPVKIITTGEGGMALTNRADLAETLRLLRSHGITRDPERMRKPADGPWYYEQIDLGHNYRMTDLQAALGFSQMSRLQEFVDRRTFLAARYTEILAGLPIILPTVTPNICSAWHLYVVRVDETRAGVRRRTVVEKLLAGGVGVNVHYIPVHTQPFYQERGFRPGDFPEAERYYAEAVSLPLFPTLEEENQDFVASVLRQSLGEK